jgi:hypothetical protein
MVSDLQSQFERITAFQIGCLRGRYMNRLHFWMGAAVVVAAVNFTWGLSQAAEQQAKAVREEGAGKTVEGQSIGLLEYSLDQGVTWHALNGKNPQVMPPVPKQHSLGFRVHKGKPELDWPLVEEGDQVIDYPVWTVTRFGEGAKTLGGDELWTGFETVAPKGTPNGTIAVECGNKITVTVQEVFSAEE